MSKIRKQPGAELGDCPSHLSASVELWNELRDSILDGIVVRACDRTAFELLVVLVGRMRSGEVKAAEVAQMRQLLAAFALVPGSRIGIDSPGLTPWPP